MSNITQTEKDFYKRLIKMYGEDQATIFYKRKVNAEPPSIEEEKEESFMDLNNL
jgi:hypothetical protein